MNDLTTTLTNDQKARLASWVIDKVAENFWYDRQQEHNAEWLGDLDEVEAMKQLAVWLKRLPGSYWNVGLPLEVK